MSKKVANLPRLRFPEFLDAGEWEEKSLGEIISLEYGSSLPEKNRNEGKIPVVGSNGIVGYHNEALIDAPAIVIGRKGSAGQVNWITSACYPIDTTFYVKNKNPSYFLISFIRLILDIINLSSFKDSSAVPGLNRKEVCLIKIKLPKLKEQQKIAACLSSLDDLITAHTQKLDALKAHKKGLMQQLFPAEGETVPKLRFLEFRDSGEWEEKTLKDVSFINQGLQIPISKRFTEKVENSYFYITNEFIKENSSKNYYIKNPPASVICNEDDILMTRTGNTGQVVTGVKGAFHNNFFKIKYSNDINKNFLVYFLISERIQNTILKLAGTSTIPDLNHGDFYSIKIKLPSLVEQQKIAACLSSLDDQITAQTQKIETLKTHKKGLMQQLFPSADR